MCPLNVTDAALIGTAALPAGATTTIASLDLGINASAPQGASAGYVGVPKADFVGDVEFELDVPALNSTQLPNSDTITFAVITDSDPAFTSPSPTTLIPSLAVQTGAGGVGAAAVSVRFRIPVTVSRYLGVSATGVSGVAASGVNFTLTAKF